MKQYMYSCFNMSVIPLLFFISYSVFSKTISHDFNVSTYIDRSLMLADTVDIELVPEYVTLSYDDNTLSFSNVNFDLNIITSLKSSDPLVNSNGYQLVLTNNVSACYDGLTPNSNLVLGYENIAQVHLDNLSQVLTIGSAVDINAFDLTEEHAKAEHKVILSFQTINGDAARYCEGSFVFGFRYNI